jgi:phage repressor protein C with HTH and peptisase S24 domain
MKLTARIAQALEEANFKHAHIARLMDVSPQAVNGWVTKGSISKANLAELAVHTKKPLEFFMETKNKAEEPAAQYSVDSKYVFIARYRAAGGAGSPVDNGHDEVDSMHAFRRDWLAKHSASASTCGIVEVKGDSMLPTLGDHDIVVINLVSKHLITGKVFAFATDEGLRIKRLFKQLDGRIRVVSDNPDKTQYPDDYLTPGTESSIIGLVIGKSGSVN